MGAGSSPGAFAVSQTTGEVRLRWDPFIRSQRLLDGATVPGKGVRTLTHARVGPRMVSEYVSCRPPTSVGMTMVRGPWFFASFGGGWRFTPERDGCRAVWKYTYAVRPRWLRPAADAALAARPDTSPDAGPTAGASDGPGEPEV